jgi:hypothetical protein
MRTVLRILGVVVVVILLAVGIVLVMGGLQPRNHTVSATVTINAPQAVVWQRITDLQSQTSWRSGLTGVDMLPAQDGHPCWQETSSFGKMPLCEVLSAAPSTRIVRISDAKLPYGGLWTYELSPGMGPTDPNVTILKITENGFTGPWIYRFVGHYIFHEDSQIKQYEADLQKSIGK